ncbi:PLP-dependent aminotransferase family protein [Jeongeupia sp. USM3]|uniref:MocR-like pyridoxine biosynthesis transcription factor PdxR n=1 Tax=Jeongeupia sp. USM3 TaxID=1906741 RepID=UPI000ACA7805|nr:PLP-dependent aminotransferase family protein [Jeongeupia sp. USM3]
MKPSLPFELTGIVLEPGQPRARQLYAALRSLIIDTPGSSGCKLPASRELAALLGVSRNTVVNVYERLFAEGFVETHTGDGTYIATLDRHPPGRDEPEAVTTPQVHIGLRQPVVQQFDQHLVHDGPPRAFRIGVPAIDLFPFGQWSRLQARFWRQRPVARMGYGDPAGDPELRELIARYLHQARGLQCDPSQVLVTLGAQQAIILCVALLLRSGDEVVIENPCYWAAAGAFAYLGVRMHGIGVDAEGLDTARLAGVPGARMAYVSPSCQYPTGATLSPARRLALLRWAESRHAWIIEDDYDGEYRYSGTPLTPLAALDRGNRVIYVGSFSKVMYPGLRLGYMVVPPQLVEHLTLLRTMSARQPPMNDQAVMAGFISGGISSSISAGCAVPAAPAAMRCARPGRRIWRISAPCPKSPPACM